MFSVPSNLIFVPKLWSWAKRHTKLCVCICVLFTCFCILIGVSWMHLWASLSHELKMFLVYLSVGIAGIVLVLVCTAYYFTTTYGLISVLPKSVKDQLYNKSLIDVFAEDSWLTSMAFDIFMAVFVELDESELQKVLDRLPPLLKTVLTQRGWIYYAPPGLQKFILPEGTEPPQPKPNSRLRRSTSGGDMRRIPSSQLFPMEDDSHYQIPEENQFSFSVDSHYSIPEDEKISQPIHKSGSHTQLANLAGIYRGLNSSRINVQSSSGLPNGFRTRNESLSGRTSDSSSRKSGKSNLYIHRKKKSRKRENIIVSLLDSRIRKSIEAFIKSYFAQPLAEVSDKQLKIFITFSGFGSAFMLYRSSHLRQFTKKGSLTAIYMFSLFVFLFCTTTLHTRDGPQRRRIMRVYRWMLYKRAQVQNYYLSHRRRRGSVLQTISESSTKTKLLTVTSVGLLGFGLFKAIKR